MGLFQKSDPVVEFWEWFGANASEIATMPPSQELTIQIGKRLQKIRKGLTFQIEPGAERSVIEISADGDKALIPTVRQVTRLAPEIPGWQVIAFRQRIATVGKMVLQGLELSADQILFRETGRDQHVVHLDLAFPSSFEGKRLRGALGAAFSVLLDSVIGEYAGMTKLGQIRIGIMSPNISSQFRPLTELPSVVDSLPDSF